MLVLALISGGASALDRDAARRRHARRARAKTSRAMASGASIRELNALRTELSAIKGGKLARALARAGRHARRQRRDRRRSARRSARARRCATEAIASRSSRRWRASATRSHGPARARLTSRRIVEPLARRRRRCRPRGSQHEAGVVVAWGEPTVALPEDHGDRRPRAAARARARARACAARDRAAFVAGSDGIDGPTRAAGAFVDGTTWDAIVAAGIDPARRSAPLRCRDRARCRRRAGDHRPTGINHADVMIVG